MKQYPSWFPAIQDEATSLWNTLDGNPKLAGPWYQLFNQVKSLQHVLSELLQNADDAGATEAKVKLEKGLFSFCHNGSDFTESEFNSLCQFGFSNKRILHTIGFRGIGFKSTFSLGKTVELLTPSLSIKFNERRFTVPIWIEELNEVSQCTTIRVQIENPVVYDKFAHMLETWDGESISLLFLKNLRALHINGVEMVWRSAQGPCKDSEWVWLESEPWKEFLLIRSAEEEFPPEAVKEIKEEKLPGQDHEQEFYLPPCRVDVIVGPGGRIYSMLPTESKSRMPYSLNAPFVLTPDRKQLKEVERSPSNQWLLSRIGQLTGRVMLEWLNNKDLSVEERSGAYDLLPNKLRELDIFETPIEKNIISGFLSVIRDRSILLTTNGDLVRQKQCRSLPSWIHDVWATDDLAKHFLESDQFPFSSYVNQSSKDKLVHGGFLVEQKNEEVINRLKKRRIPKPASNTHLYTLWSNLQELLKYRSVSEMKLLNVIPVAGNELMQDSESVLRVTTSGVGITRDDWQFLSAHIELIDIDWLMYLEEIQAGVASATSHGEQNTIDKAFSFLRQVDLTSDTDPSRLINHVALKLRNSLNTPKADYIRLAHIAAHLSVQVEISFRYLNIASEIRSVDEGVVFDRHGDIAGYLPPEYVTKYMIHPMYRSRFISCTLNEWLQWSTSLNSGLSWTIPLRPSVIRISDRNKVKTSLRERDHDSEIHFHFKGDQFILNEKDFEKELWKYWMEKSEEDHTIWFKVMSIILRDPRNISESTMRCTAIQRSQMGTSRPITDDWATAIWIIKFRQLKCLPDTKGNLHRPSELLLRTQQTEPMLDVEHFIHRDYDTEANRRLLLLLGVRDVPPSPDRILGYLRGIATMQQPPLDEVVKWCGRLDKLYDTAATADVRSIREAFRGEKLILTDDATWMSASAVFLHRDEEDIPGFPVINRSLRDLTLWKKVGVAEHPTIERALKWVKDLPSGVVLPSEDKTRLKALFKRHAEAIWLESGHWLNLLGEWVPQTTLRNKLTLGFMRPWAHFDNWVKKETADMQELAAGVHESPPFNAFRPLHSVIVDQFASQPVCSGSSFTRPWLRTVGGLLRRVRLEDEDALRNIQAFGAALERLHLQETLGITVIPYIDNKPAGPGSKRGIVWVDDVIYLQDEPEVKQRDRIIKLLVERLGRKEFDHLIPYCCERPEKDIEDYISSNFDLLPKVSGQTDSAAMALSAGVDPSPATFDVPVEAERAGIMENDPADKVAAQGGQLDPEMPLAAESPADQIDQDNPEKPQAEKPEKLPHGQKKASVIEEFALAMGFRKGQGEQFIHPDRRVMCKISGFLFPWQLQTPDGSPQKFYYPSECSSEQHTIELPAECWMALESDPEKYSLIVKHDTQAPVEYKGAQLKTMLQREELRLTPARYCVVFTKNGRT